MKNKKLLLTIICAVSLQCTGGVFAEPAPMIPAAIQSTGGINTHDMDILKQQQIEQIERKDGSDRRKVSSDSAGSPQFVSLHRLPRHSENFSDADLALAFGTVRGSFDYRRRVRLEKTQDRIRRCVPNQSECRSKNRRRLNTARFPCVFHSDCASGLGVAA